MGRNSSGETRRNEEEKERQYRWKDSGKLGRDNKECGEEQLGRDKKEWGREREREEDKS